MTTRMTGTIRINALALDPIHHGAGSIGNVQVLRMQSIIDKDGAEHRVPFVSGNSIKHMVRAGGATYAREILGIEDGSMTKGMVDLFYSGGGLTKGGSAVNLAKAREIERLFPLLAVLGYGAGNTMQASRLSCSHLHLVCKENDFRMPEQYAQSAHAAMLSGEFVSEDFGTRHDAARNPEIGRLLAHEERKLIEGEISGNASKKVASEKVKDSAQMIYEFETIKAGSMFFGEMRFRDLDGLEMGALQSALARACIDTHDGKPVYTVGAKSSTGFGRMAFEFSGAIRDVARPTMTEDAGLAGVGQSSEWLKAYEEHLRTHSREINAVLREVAE